MSSFRGLIHIFFELNLDFYTDIPTFILKRKEYLWEEKRFYKTYSNNDRLEISFLGLDSPPTVGAEDTTPSTPLNEEIVRDPQKEATS